MKKEKKVWVLTLLAFWLLSPNQTKAQQDSIRYLDELTISGARVEQPIIEVPRSVTFIGKDVIETAPYNSVGELLSTQAGVSIIGINQTPGTNQSLFMRGANSNQFAVLIDGKRITDPSSPNAAIDLSEISLTDVERIEIIRGAHSTLYGGAAIGGAINIITKKGRAPGFHGSVSAQGGTFGKGSATGSQNVNLNYSFEKGLYVTYALFNQNVRGLNATEDTIKDVNTYKTSDRDNFRKTDSYLKAGYQKGGWDVSLMGKYSGQNADIDNGAYSDDDNAFITFSRKLLDYNASYKVNDALTLSWLGSWSDSERKNKNDSSKTDYDGNFDHTFFNGKYYGNLNTNEIEAKLRFKTFSATVGAGRFGEQMSFDTYYFSNAFGFPYESRVDYDSIDTKTVTNYAFIQSQWEVKNFLLSAGARIGDHSKFGNFFTYELSPSYRFNDLLVYGSISSAFNAPSLYQLYDPTKGYGAYTSKGNIDLNPEQSLSFEVGVKKEFHNGSYFTLSSFTTRTNDAIEYVYLWQNGKPIEELGYSDYLGDTYINMSKQVVKGIELTGLWKIDKFYLNGNFTYLDGKVTLSPDDVDENHTGGNYVQSYNYGAFINKEYETSTFQRRPMFTGTIEAGYKLTPKVTVFSSAQKTGQRYDVVYDETLGPFGALGRSAVKSFTLLNIGANYAVSKSWQLAFRIDNILDEQYREILGFQTRGRSAYLKATFKW